MKHLVWLLFVVACGSKSSSPAEPGAPVMLPDKPFDDLTYEQKEAFMKQKVVPAMAPIFKQHDATEFAAFDCKTCHGKQAEQGQFDMPNPELPKLNFKDMSKFKPADIEWMKNEVKPTMAKLLSRPEFSPQNAEGFGCQNCHITE